ncbi:MAG: TRAP transporter substrate-binding protein [Bacillota bacterium]|nr:TRAP transporter substrate-binding protein [Bacillota bacterium]
MKNKKLIGMLLFVVLLAVITAGCGSEPQEQGNTEQTWELKAGHVAAASHPMNTQLIEMAKELEEKTNGRVKLDVFPEASLGGEREMIEGARIGTMDIVLSTSAVTGNFVPQMKLFDLPFLFKDRDHAVKVLNGDIGQQLLDSTTNQDLIGLAFWENGFRNLTNSKRAVEKPEDLVGLKIRTMENPIHMDAWKALGADPTPMAFAEVFTSLQQGAIDGQENPLAIISTSRLYEVQQHLSMTNHNYSPMVLMISKQVWDSFPEDIQVTFKELALKYGEIEREMLMEAELAYMDEMTEQGMTVSNPDTTLFREKVKSVYDKYADEIGADIIQQVLETN